MQEKFSFHPVSVKDAENVIKNIPNNKAARGDIPIQILKQPGFTCFQTNQRYQLYMTSCKYQVMPHLSPWFSVAFAAAIVYKNHFFYLCQQNQSSASKVKFRQASSHCKSVLETAKLACDLY